MSLTGASESKNSVSAFDSKHHDDTSTKNFMPLNDGASEDGSVHYGNKSGVRGNDIELAAPEAVESTQSIHVVRSYSIRR